MPKLDDYDDSHSDNPVSDSAKSSITAKVTSGASTLNTAPATANTVNSSVSSGTFGSVPASGFGTSSSGFGGSSSGFGGSTPSFGGSSSGFGGNTPSFGSANNNNNMGQVGGAMQEGGTTAIEVSHGFGDFINSKWRPLMAVIYMVTVACDFVIFPILWSILQHLSHGNVTSQWNPLTLQGAGLYHIAMGAVLGLAAYGRSQEKIAGKA